MLSEIRQELGSFEWDPQSGSKDPWIGIVTDGHAWHSWQYAHAHDPEVETIPSTTWDSAEALLAALGNAFGKERTGKRWVPKAPAELFREHAAGLDELYRQLPRNILCIHRNPGRLARIPVFFHPARIRVSGNCPIVLHVSLSSGMLTERQLALLPASKRTNRVATAISLADVTQVAVAGAIGVTQAYVSDVARQRHSTITVPNAWSSRGTSVAPSTTSSPLMPVGRTRFDGSRPPTARRESRRSARSLAGRSEPAPHCRGTSCCPRRASVVSGVLDAAEGPEIERPTGLCPPASRKATWAAYGLMAPRAWMRQTPLAFSPQKDTNGPASGLVL